MGRDPSIPTLYQLEQPEKLEKVLEQDKPEDCLPCKVIGSGAFIGLGAYSYFSGQSQLRKQQAAIVKSGSMFGMRSRQAGITTIATVLVGMGVWRLTH
ncbi:hypothetical protein L228DRAFT_251622 [Xylona heveae TC161]|uniref:Distal membrane-arm assembly complex protein 1-like domain-containing protein n=1 Tax=Xylona heveae (strain CBS 132557 / TC161) TaxID=1328760 RepID=A0A164ZG29_XYLHT|nr:hypothetical protein L228DRAFT_251622 [Xylona heveae TC161]KZF19060.1 hypothetical protein L228DRAFT_251622 [Xylona heveae TC161]